MRHTIIVFFKGMHPIYGSVERFECNKGPVSDDLGRVTIYPDGEKLPQTFDLKDIAHYQVIPTGGVSGT